jgi:hypothetical protein
MRLVALAAAALAVALPGATTAATSKNRILSFATVAHDTVPWGLAGPARDAGAQIVNRVIDAPGQGTEVDFRKFFAVYVFVIRPTAGFDLTIRRIVLQRFGSYAQICARVTLRHPTGTVTQEKSMSAHYVKIKRGRLGFDLPDHIVVRDPHDGVLVATPGSRKAACT